MSILTVPNLFASKTEELTAFFKKNLLYQGLAGLATCIIGTIALIQCTLKIATVMAPILWLTEMLCTAALAFFGLLLSYNLIYILFLSKGKKSEENLNKMLTNIMPLQGKLSILGILLGIWSVVAAVMFAA
jgi:hypothetical protein